MKRQSREIRTDQELQKASEHLYYEYVMLISLAQALQLNIAAQNWQKNALLESFVIHFRVLLNFFYEEQPKLDDVIADDYLSQGDWKNLRPPLSSTLLKAKKRAHKEVAHLTYARVDISPEAKVWDFLAIAKEVESLIELFLKNIPKNRLNHSWLEIDKLIIEIKTSKINTNVG